MEQQYCKKLREALLSHAGSNLVDKIHLYHAFHMMEYLHIISHKQCLVSKNHNRLKKIAPTLQLVKIQAVQIITLFLTGFSKTGKPRAEEKE
jgi:hypothetical protein